MAQCTSGGMWGDDSITSIISFYKNNLVGIKGQDIIATINTANMNIPYKNLVRYKIVLEPETINSPLFYLDKGITFIGFMVSYETGDKTEQILEYRLNGSDIYQNVNKIYITNSIADSYLPNLFFNNHSTEDRVYIDVLVAYDDEVDVDNGICGCDDTVMKLDIIRELKIQLKKKLELNCSNIEDGVEYITRDIRLNDISLVDNKFYYQTDFASGLYMRKDNIWYYKDIPNTGKSLSNTYQLILDDIGYSLITSTDLILEINDNIFSDFHVVKILNPQTIELSIITNYEIITGYDLTTLNKGTYFIEFNGNKIYIY
jgi:hypothetical protein